jgi:hypothetical protein
MRKLNVVLSLVAVLIMASLVSAGEWYVVSAKLATACTDPMDIHRFQNLSKSNSTQDEFVKIYNQKVKDGTIVGLPKGTQVFVTQKGAHGDQIAIIEYQGKKYYTYMEWLTIDSTKMKMK